MSARNFVWLSIGGGAWSLASNWDDTTDGNDPSLVPPGAQDDVTVAGPNGAALQTITSLGSGPAQAAAALFTGNTLLTGSFDIAALTLGQAGGGQSGGLLQLAAGSALSAGTASVVAGSLLLRAGASLGVSGSLTLGSTQDGPAATLDATGGGTADVGSLFLASGADSIYVDPTSILEVGGTGGGAAGQLTVDAGATIVGQGDANGYGAVTNNGTLAAQGGTLLVGTLTGTGMLAIDAGATLALNGACGAGQSVAFAGANATLALEQEFFAPQGVVSGFAAGDAIDVVGSVVTSAKFAAGSTGGVLSLFYGTQVAATLQLSGSYAGDVFLTARDGAGGTRVTVSQGSSGGGTAPPGTATADDYTWTAASGAWKTVANWSDVSRGQTPAAVAPGVHDLVTVTALQGSFSVLAGPANAASLALSGEVALSGAYGIGTLSVGQADASSFTDGTLDLLTGTAMTAGSAAIEAGEISVSGSASALAVAGTLTLGGGPGGIGLPMAALTVSAGGSVSTAALAMGGGSGASIATDPTASVEITGGAAGGQAVAGAVTVDTRGILSGNGSINPFGQIVDNGLVLASGGMLSLGSVSGNGTLAVAAGATLQLLAPTAVGITLQGSATEGGSALALADARDAPTGTITGLAVGDVIHLEGSQLTSLQYSAASNTLVLIYGSSVVARLALAGGLAGVRFVLSPDGTGGSVITLAAATGGGGGGGQTGTDALSWTHPVSGGWGVAGNWTDTTTATVANAPPGAQTPVTIAGPAGSAFQDISGTGTCASMTASGNTMLNGSFFTGQLTLTAGATMEAGVTSQLQSSQTEVTGATLLASGHGAVVNMAGTLTLDGTGAVAGALASGLLQCSGLALDAATASVICDIQSAIEVGTLGGTETGALTIDPGNQIAGQGSLDLSGVIVDDGTILAQGGTLAVGAVSGGGSLAIGTEATLSLTAAAACQVAITGGGATLLLAAPAIASGLTVTGFAIGDAIVTGDTPLDGVSYQPTGAGVGTLTLDEAGQTIGQLTLQGDYTGQVFSVQPDGAGAQVIVTTQIIIGPPPGTVTPDEYVWTGAQSTAWSDAANWTDVSAGQSPAAVAPGLNDSVTVAGGSGRVLGLVGPADAASLSLSGTVSLLGTYAVGALAETGGGVLAVAMGNQVNAASASIVGAAAVSAGTLAVAGTLALGAAGGAGGALLAASGAAVQLGSALLDGDGAAISVDAASSVEIGGNAGAAAGSVTIDAGGVLAGTGSVAAAGAIVNQGTITASGGMLLLSAVSGTGTLLVGVGAELDLLAAASPGLVADFAGGGGILSLSAAAAADAPAIADFGTGDAIEIAAGGATAADYLQTAPGAGVLTVLDGSQVLAQLTLLGNQAGRVFNVAGSAGGGTILTATPEQNAGTGGGFVINPQSSTGTVVTPYGLEASLQGAFTNAAITDLANLLAGESVFEWFSADGAVADPASDFYPSVEVVGGNVTPDTTIAMQQGYSAVLLEGSEPLGVTDSGLGHALLVGNAGHDQLAALGDGDTLMGAPGASTTFYASLAPGVQAAQSSYDVTIQGGGSDYIATNNDAALVFTGSGGRSQVFLGSPQNFGATNDVQLNGADTVICGSFGQQGRSYDNVTVSATAYGGELAFGPNTGVLSFVGGNTPATVVGSGGQIVMQGGAANGSILWGGASAVDYVGGAGSAVIVGGAQQNQVVGGSGAVTVFGGTGEGEYSGAVGSVFVVGAGASTVQAAAGVGVYIGGGGNTSVAGSSGADAYAGSSTADNIFQAGAGPETMWGGLGNDLFLAGSGAGLFVSGGGQDVFSFTSGLAGGSDVIAGFLIGQDTIKLNGYGPTAPPITYAYGDSILNLQDGTQIVVYGVTNLTSSSIVTG